MSETSIPSWKAGLPFGTVHVLYPCEKGMVRALVRLTKAECDDGILNCMPQQTLLSARPSALVIRLVFRLTCLEAFGKVPNLEQGVVSWH